MSSDGVSFIFQSNCQNNFGPREKPCCPIGRTWVVRSNQYSVRIQKPPVTYNPGNSSVTNCVILPNFIKINLQYYFYAFLKVPFNSFLSQILYFHFNSDIYNICRNLLCRKLLQVSEYGPSFNLSSLGTYMTRYNHVSSS
jgi:hypothetical protein